MDTHDLSPQIGPRVKYAREKVGLNQIQLAVAMGFNDRQTISDIENGKRGVKADELVKLGELLDQDLQFFIDPFSVVAEAQYSWRASADVLEAELDDFQAKAGAWVGLLRWMRAQRGEAQDPLKFALKLDASSTYESAQRMATLLVAQFELGPVPATTLAKTIEERLDIPVLFVDTAPGLSQGFISGAACHLEDLGVILINRRDSEARRNFDLAHELFHCLTWEAMRPEHRESGTLPKSSRARRIEQLADNFACELLMPAAALKALAKEGSKDAKRWAGVASRLRVTNEALSWRLLNLGLIDAPAQKALARERTAPAEKGLPPLFSKNFVALLHEALDNGRLTARKAAKALGFSLGDLSTLFDAHGMTAPFEL